MWSLYRQSATFHQRPSEIIGDMTPWVAWMFDEAVMAAGAFVQNRLDERDKKHKPRWSFDQIIRGHAMVASPRKQSAKERWKAMFGPTMR